MRGHWRPPSVSQSRVGGGPGNRAERNPASCRRFIAVLPTLPAICCVMPRRLLTDVAGEVQAEEPVQVGERLELGTVGYFLIPGQPGQAAQRGRSVQIGIERAQEIAHVLRA